MSDLELGAPVGATLRAIFAEAEKLIEPKERLGFYEWVETNRILPFGSARAGPFKIDWCAAAVEIYKTLENEDVRELVLCGPTQTVKTELLLNYLFYIVDTDPASIKYIIPTETLTKEIVETRVNDGLSEMPDMKEMLAPDKKRRGNTTYLRKFAGGFVSFIWSGGKTGLISTPTKYILLDELDKFEVDVRGKMNSRQTMFADSKRLIVSSAGIEGLCRITQEYKRGHQAEWHVRCQKCSELFVPKIDLLEWDKGPRDAVMLCAHCNAEHDDDLMRAANRQGEYVSKYNLGRIASFRLNAFAHPMLTLETLAREYIEARQDLQRKGDEQPLKDFTNERLAMPFRSSDRPINIEAVRAKLASLQPREKIVDRRVAYITIAVDVQGDRLEAEARGWFLTENKTYKKPRVHSIGIERAIIHGDITDPTSDCLAKLLEFYETSYFIGSRASGLKIKAKTLGIDSGYQTQSVASFTRGRFKRGIVPLKGITPSAANRTDPALLAWPSRSKSVAATYGNILLLVDSNKCKDFVFARIKQAMKVARKNATPIILWPADGKRGYGDDYFDGLDAERVVEKMIGGAWRNTYVREKSCPNESLDLLCYNHALMQWAGWDTRISIEARRLAKRKEKMSEPAKPKARRKAKQGGVKVHRL